MYVRATSYYKTSYTSHIAHIKQNTLTLTQSSLTYNNQGNKLHQTQPDFTFINRIMIILRQ